MDNTIAFLDMSTLTACSETRSKFKAHCHSIILLLADLVQVSSNGAPSPKINAIAIHFTTSHKLNRPLQTVDSLVHGSKQEQPDRHVPRSPRLHDGTFRPNLDIFQQVKRIFPLLGQNS